MNSIVMCSGRPAEWSKVAGLHSSRAVRYWDFASRCTAKKNITILLLMSVTALLE